MTLEILTSDRLGSVRHGFFTRRGGASSGVFSGLNCGLGSSDQADVVQINRTRVAKAMQVTPEKMVSLQQVHSADVLVVRDPMEGRVEADAEVTKTPGLVLTVLTADCQPVLLLEPEVGVIGAAHAGWRGALDGVLDNTVEAMVGLGAIREQIVAVIGPSISQRAYEVGPEFCDTFLKDDPENAKFFLGGLKDRMQFNLPGFGLHRLRQAGVGHAEWIRLCTYSDADRFFSFRRSTHTKEADYGRLISAIKL